MAKANEKIPLSPPLLIHVDQRMWWEIGHVLGSIYTTVSNPVEHDGEVYRKVPEVVWRKVEALHNGFYSMVAPAECQAGKEETT